MTLVEFDNEYGIVVGVARCPQQQSESSHGSQRQASTSQTLL